MYCRACGVWNEDDGRAACSACGKALQPLAADPKLGGSNHLVWAILATVLCCLPFGVAGIVYAAQIDGKVAAGDFEGARASAKQARLFTWIAFGTGLASVIAYGLLAGAGVLAEVLKTRAPH